MPSNRLTLSLVVVLALFVAANNVAAAQAGTPAAAAAHEMHPSTPQPGLPNFSEVTTNLYRGAQPDKQGFEKLAKMGVNIVVDLRGTREHEKREAERLGMQYVAIPWHCYNPKDELFARFITLLRENPDKKVFVHCRLGEDRTGMMIAAYRMSEQGWSAEEAMKDMKVHGYSSFHHMLCPRLAPYEARFPEVIKKSPAFQKLRRQENPVPEK